ncbi:UvrD-helicase domain-containing protein [Deinococcus terrestris]|uniref:UvrD-helicase domain-containing protein n=1 Tax=Deinococcus terrestris TaxID=2651870 RepID=UPI00128AEC12|nr:UvrD-helicase domain-containing protein [Deinococcus terrestris]
MTLTDEQQRGITFGGSVAIDAGAGSGKTFVLTRRLLRQMQEGLQPEELVAVTFTEAAAAELRTRLQTLLEEEAHRSGDARLASAARTLPLAQISTIHALCARIIRDHPVESGAGLRFQVLDESQAAVWLDGVLPDVLATLPPGAFGAVPAALALDAVTLMLRDPHRAEAALQVSLTGHEARQQALEERLERQAQEAAGGWEDALHLLRGHSSSDPDDGLERARMAALQAAAVTGSWTVRQAAMHGALRSVRSNAGNARVWGAAKAVVHKAVQTLQRLSVPQGPLEAEVWQAQAVPVLARLYGHAQGRLNALKAEQEVLTFADLERLAARTLRHDEVRAYYQARWKAVCVDEFQDTSPLQWEILSALAPEGVNFTVVGDEKQSIYAFRGADVRPFREARAQIAARGGATISLHRSFRTHAPLVEVINTFFQSFMPGPSGAGSTAASFTPLQAHRRHAPHPSPPCELHVVRGPVGVTELRAAEADLIAHRIQALLAEGRTVEERGRIRPLTYRDVAVLLRIRTNLPLYEGALFHAGIPSAVQGGRGLLDRPEVRDLTQLLFFLAQPADDLALAAVLRSPMFGWSDERLRDVAAPRPRGFSLWQALDAAGAPPLLQTLCERRGSLTASALVTLALEGTQHATVMASLPDGMRRLANIDAFLSLLHTWAAAGRADVQSAALALQDALRLDLPVPEATLGSDDAVQIMTIHGSKGLEFPVVIVPDLLQQGRADSAPLLMDAERGLALRVPGLPGAQQPALHLKLQDLQAERRASEAERLMYVALTRAADALILTMAAKPSQAPDVAALTRGFPQEDVTRFAYEHHRIPRPEPWTLRRTGRVHGARMQESMALPESLPVTSLGAYLHCPRAFGYRYVAGRPPFSALWTEPGPLGTGRAGGAVIGSAVHQAIELGWSAAAIRAGFPHLRDAERQEVATLAGALSSPAFAALPTQPPQREVPLSLTFEDLQFEGVIDAHYGHWLVDYKTDRSVSPDDHAPQLALYLQATGAERASLAYLRQEVLYTLNPAEVERGLAQARHAAQGIRAGVFTPTPSAPACRLCLYRQVCDASLFASAPDAALA